MDSSEPTLAELTTQQLIGFVETGAPISPAVANHLRAMSPEERIVVAGSIEFEDPEVSPNRREWLTNMAARTGLIDLMAEPETIGAGRIDQTSGAEPERGRVIETTPGGHTFNGRHTRASLGRYLARQR